MPNFNSPDQPLGDSQFDPTLQIPELDELLKSGLPQGETMGAPAGGPTFTPVPGGAAGIPQGAPTVKAEDFQKATGMTPPGMEGMMPPGMNPALRPGGPSPMGPGAEIASKLGKPQKDPEAQAIGLITTSITKLNQLGDLLMASDEASAKAVRQMIRILGEILKSAEHGKPVPLPPMA